MNIYVLLLIAYPLVRAGRGLYVGDTTYSPANFTFHGSMSGTWTIATYLANVLGSYFTKLPGGSTLLGLNIYTSLVVSLTALIAFLVLKKDINIHVLFVGEILALSLCWCPTTILYNYLTYLLFTAGALLLYMAVCADGEERRKPFFIAAGICLGLNVFTRLPNVTEAALILVVWFAALIRRRKISETLLDTLFCVTGYVIGFLVPWAAIRYKYSPTAFTDMISNMFSMTEKATDYKPVSMIAAMFEDYAYAGRWIALWAAAMLICGVFYAALEMDTKDRNAAVFMKAYRYKDTIHAFFAVLMFGLIIRLCYGRGMFSFRYYEYGCMYFWAVLLLLATTLIALFIIFKEDPLCSGKDNWEHKRILSMIALIMIYITCIGSNNGLYPIVNNMFICGPYIAWVLWDAACALYRYSRGKSIAVSADETDAAADETDSVAEAKAGTAVSDPAELMSGRPRTRALIYTVTLATSLLFIGTFIQGFGFHMVNAFNDGINGEKLTFCVTGYERTAHIRTSSENAKNLQGLMDYMYANKTGDDSVILYGEIPGLGYILDMPSALTTFWPDLDSYNYFEWQRDLDAVAVEKADHMPYVIVSLPVAALEGGDPDVIAYFGEETAKYDGDRKLADLIGFIHTYGYEQVYVNDAYAVYVCH